MLFANTGFSQSDYETQDGLASVPTAPFVNSKKKNVSSQKADTRPRPRPNSPRSPAPPRSKNSPAPFSFSVFRFMQLNQADSISHQLFNQTGLNTPGATYLLSTFAFRTAGNARSFTDYSGFLAGLNFYSPQVSGFGLAATLSAAGANTDTWRGGPYHAFRAKWGSIGLFLVNHLLLNRMAESAGRFLSLWNISYAGGLVSSIGSISYSWNNDVAPAVSTISVDPTLSVRLYESVKLAVSYSFSNSFSNTGDVSSTTLGYGLEINQSF